MSRLLAPATCAGVQINETAKRKVGRKKRAKCEDWGTEKPFLLLLPFFPNTPSYCLCGVKNDINHALMQKRRVCDDETLNCIRKLEAELMQEVSSDVRIEPELTPLDNNLMTNGNNAEKSRLDVSGIGVWGSFERTLLDRRVMHPNVPSYVDKRCILLTKKKRKEHIMNE